MSDHGQGKGHFESEFIVAGSATEAVAKLEGLLAKLKVEAAREAAAGVGVDVKPPALGGYEVGAQSAIADKPVEAAGLKIEDAGPDFDPDDVIAQLMAATKGDRTTKQAQAKSVKDSDSDSDDGEMSDQVATILRRYRLYFDAELNGAREAMQRGDTAGMVGYILGAEVIRQAGSFIAKDGDTMLAERHKTLHKIGPLLKGLRDLVEGLGSDDKDRKDRGHERDTSNEN